MITKLSRFYRDGRIFATSTHSLGGWVRLRVRRDRPPRLDRRRAACWAKNGSHDNFGGAVGHCWLRADYATWGYAVGRGDAARRNRFAIAMGGVLHPGRPRSCGRASGTVGFRRAQASVRHGGHRRARASVRGAGATGLAQACSWNVCILRKPLAHAAIMELWKAHRR